VRKIEAARTTQTKIMERAIRKRGMKTKSKMA
jgi:hypothetical protein